VTTALRLVGEAQRIEGIVLGPDFSHVIDGVGEDVKRPASQRPASSRGICENAWRCGAVSAIGNVALGINISKGPWDSS
jgi:hypothetical protein